MIVLAQPTMRALYKTRILPAIGRLANGAGMLCYTWRDSAEFTLTYLDACQHPLLCLMPSLNTLSGLLAVLLWSATVALARSLSERVGPLSAAAAVYGIGGAAALLTLVGRGRWRATLTTLPRRYLLGCGALFTAYMLALFVGLGRADSRAQTLEVGLLNYLWPTLTILFSLPLLHTRANWLLWPGAALGLGGAFLVLTQGAALSWASFSQHVTGNPLAYLLGLTAAVTWALYSNLTRRWAGGAPGGGVSVFLPATGLILFSLSRVAGESPAWTWPAWREALGLGLITWLAYALWDRAMRQGDVVLVVAFSYLTPFFSIVVSTVYLAVRPAAALWWGCAAIVGGAWLSWWAVEADATHQAKSLPAAPD